MKAYLRSLFVVILFISGCVPVTKNVEQPTETFSSSTTALPAVVIAPTSSPTSLPPTIKIKQDCLSLEDQLPLNVQLTGVWVRQYRSPYLENLEENTKYSVPLYGGGVLYNYDEYWSVSPNGEWLAYIDVIVDTSERMAKTKGYSLRVIHSSGHSLSMDYWPVSFQTIYGWVDNQSLLLGLNNREIVLNPFSGKWYEIKDSAWLKGMYASSLRRDVKQYSPHLDQIIVRLEDHSELRDADSGKIIIGDSSLGFFSRNVWSPDGVMLALVMNDENVIHLFQENREILKVDLAQVGLFPNNNGHVYFSNLEWSLNHQKLLVETFDASFVMDVDKQEIYDICFVDKDLEKSMWFKSFFYSKDGQYVVTPVLLRVSDFTFQSFDVLIDIKNMRAYKLPTPEYKGRIGWLVLP